MEKTLNEILQKYKDDLSKLSDTIWEYAEVGFDTPKSANLLITFLKDKGFSVDSSIANIEHAFVAKYEGGGPKIGFLGEYDALENMNQDFDVTYQSTSFPELPGHACGHNLLGVGSLAAALATKDYLIQNNIQGSVYYYGCPAEESGYAKKIMAESGVFDSLDFCLTWHPHYYSAVWSDKTLAVIQAEFEFEGLASHASLSPELGRSALDASELMNIGCNYLREHMSNEARIHYAYINAGGSSANVVQNRSKLNYMIREKDYNSVNELYKRIIKVGEGAALMTETKVSYENVASCKDLNANRALSEVLDKVISNLNFRYSSNALEKARRLSPSNDQVSTIPLEFNFKKQGYVSTDVGDVSWKTPLAQAFLACEPYGTPMHSWQWVANGKSELAHESLVYAGLVLSLTALEVVMNGDIMNTIYTEFNNQKNAFAN